MAITAPVVTGDFSGFLPPELSAPIFEKARRSSAVQSLARQIPLGANGQAIPVTTGKAVAGWVAEGAQKPATKRTSTLKTITPQKLAAITVVSAEVVRANPADYIEQFRDDIAESFGVAFDMAALYDLGPDGTGTGPFSTFLAQTAKVVELGTGATLHNDFVAALSALVADGKKLTGFAIDDTMEPLLLDAVDGQNRPLYLDLPYQDDTVAAARRGRLIGRPSYMVDGIAVGDVLGFAGDWRECAWGVVGGITYDVSTEATVTINGNLVSLWENNLVAIRAEAEYGWLCNDTAAFVEIQDAT